MRRVDGEFQKKMRDFKGLPFEGLIQKIRTIPQFDEDLRIYKQKASAIKNDKQRDVNIQNLDDSTPGYIVVQALRDAYEEDRWGIERLFIDNDQLVHETMEKDMNRYARNTVRPFQTKTGGDKEWEAFEKTREYREKTHQFIVHLKTLGVPAQIEKLDEWFQLTTATYYDTYSGKARSSFGLE
jgi:hypothetical protein